MTSIKIGVLQRKQTTGPAQQLHQLDALVDFQTMSSERVGFGARFKKREFQEFVS